MKTLGLAIIVAVLATVSAVGAECPKEFVCIPRSLSPDEVADLSEWQKELGVIAFTLPQASSIANSLIEADTQRALDKMRAARLGWVAEFGWRADTTDSESGAFVALGPRFSWRGLSLFVVGEAWTVDAALRAGVRVEF